MTDRPWLEHRAEELRLRLHVQPRASRTEVTGRHGERLKVRLKAVPEDGAANAELCAFLAKAFGVPRDQVSLLSGQTTRDKLVSIRRPARMPDWLLAEAP